MEKWIGGSSLADNVWDAIKKYIPKGKRKPIAEELIDIFENHNCDTDGTVLYETAFPGSADEGEEYKENYFEHDHFLHADTDEESEDEYEE